MGKRLHLNILRGDKALWIIVSLLLLVSLLIAYSATTSVAYRVYGGDYTFYLFRQIRFIMIGFFVIILFHSLNYKGYAKIPKSLFWVSLALVALVYFIGLSKNEASRWMGIPGLIASFQPSEILKVALIILLAQQLGARQHYIGRAPLLPPLTSGGWKANPQRSRNIYHNISKPLLLPLLLSCALVMPSNLSTALIIFGACTVMMSAGGVRARQLTKFVFLTLLAGLLMLSAMKLAGVGRAQTQFNRIVQFVTPAAGENGGEESNANKFQVEQANIAIASGGIFGKGPGNSTQRSQLPHAYDDFVYAFIVEEYGLVGGIIIFVLYLWLFYRSGLIASQTRHPAKALIVIGLSTMITMQAFVNMCVSVGLMPVTGQPLPLISMGGSSVMMTCVAIGLILGVSRENEKERLAEEKALAAEAAEEEASPAAAGVAALPRAADDNKVLASSKTEATGPPDHSHSAPVSKANKKTSLFARQEAPSSPVPVVAGEDDDELRLVDRSAPGTTATGTGHREVINLEDDDWDDEAPF